MEGDDPEPPASGPTPGRDKYTFVVERESREFKEEACVGGAPPERISCI